MVRPQVLSIDESLIPEGSAATTAAIALMGDGALKLIELFKPESGAYEERENRILLEYAIGARQYLWKGAKPVYDSEADDPRSPHYNFGD